MIGNEIRLDGITAICEALKTNTALTTLALSGEDYLKKLWMV